MNKIFELISVLMMMLMVTMNVMAEPFSVDCKAKSQYMWDDMDEFRRYPLGEGDVRIQGDLIRKKIELKGFGAQIWDGEWVVNQKTSREDFRYGRHDVYLLRRIQAERTRPEVKMMTLMGSLKTGSIHWAGEDGVIVVSLHCKNSK